VVFSISVTSFAQENTKGNEEIKEDSAVETLQEEEPLEEAQTEENKETSTVKEEDPKKEAPKEEQPKEEPKKEDPQPKEAEKSKEKEEVKEVEKTKEKEEPKEETLNPSLDVSLKTDKELYENGDTLSYSITLTNDGEVDLKNIQFKDDLNGSYTLDHLPVGEKKTLNKKYHISKDNNLEEIKNDIQVSAIYKGKTILEKLTFLVGFKEYFTKTEVPQEKSLMMARTSNQYEDTVEVDKKATRIKPGCRLYEVVLDITGTPPPKPVDVVLVIDRSGSMEGTPLADAKTAAKSFADNVLGNNNPNNNRIAVVSYAYTAGTNLSWSSNLNSVKAAINGLNSSGTTNIHDGFRKAETQIDNARAIANKAIVLLSDGVANRYMDYHWFWGWEVHSSSTNPTSHTTATQKAYQTGQALQSKANIFTIGLLNELSGATKTVAEETLQWSAPTGQYYNAPTPGDLTGIYNQISQQVNYFATNAVVVDKIGNNFELVPGSLPTGATYNSTTREITWTPGTIGSPAQLKYQVRAKASFPGGLADTNEYATLTYTDVNGNAGQTKNFPVPQVDVAVPLSVSLTDASITLGDSINLGAGTNPSEENYMSPITGGDGNGNYTYEWRILEDSNIISTDENPTVSPTQDTEYELTVIDSNGCKAIATMKVIVEDPKGTITIKKMVQSPKPEDANKEFDIFVNGPNGTEYVVTLKNGESVTLENLEIGTYTISEIVPMNYKLVGITNSSISLSLNNLDGSSTVTNKPDNDGWFYDDDPLVNKFKVGILTQ
jgi:uncharacterized repeat protein (TIGR01451 family)